MTRRFLLIRVKHYYRRNGLAKTVKRAFQKVRQVLFESSYFLFCADLLDLDERAIHSGGEFQVECLKEESEMLEADMRALSDHIDEKIVKYMLAKRFSRGAMCWLLKTSDVLMGYIWTMVGGTIEPYFVPVQEKEVHLFDNFMFEEFRGRGYNTFLIEHVLSEVRLAGCVRAYGETRTTNVAEIRSLSQTSFKRFAKARKFQFFGRNVTIWSKAS